MYIGVDIGGSNLVAGLVDESGRILAKAKTPTDAFRGEGPVVADIISVTRRCVEEAGLGVDAVQSLGVGSPGIIDRERGLLVYSSNIPFKNTPIVDILKKEWNRPVYVENDANCAAIGELYAGAAKNAENVVVVTIGTGIGGGVILGGKLFSGAGGAGAEIGHMAIEVGGEKCTCGRHGCWEAYASALGLRNATVRAMEKAPGSRMWELCEGKTENASARTAFEAAKLGDKDGKALVDWYIKRLSAGIINIANIFRPELICLGGGVSNEDDALFLHPIREYVKNEVYAFESCPVEIIKAELGNDAGIIGAAFLYRQ